MNDLILYHGSKFGISGEVKPISRDICDFGKGFYMGSEKKQALALICGYQNSKIYTLSVNLFNLKVFEFEIGIEWALYVAFNRGKMDNIKGTKIYERFENLNKEYDVIIGYIANDRLFLTLDRFFSNDITDEVLIRSLSVLNLGKQYVFKTSKACEQIKIISVENISSDERELLKVESEKNRENAIELTEKVNIEYRRIGKYFDEILKEMASDV